MYHCRKTSQALVKRVVLYSHDTLGFGHLRRNLMLAQALKDLPDAPDVMLIAGTYEAGAFDIPEGIDMITLPAYAKSSAGKYTSRRLGIGLDELRTLRSKLIKSALKQFRPDLLIVDNVPLGAQGELEPALTWLSQKTSARRVLGLRDVLDERLVVRRQWLQQRNFEAVNKYFTDVWVYGDPTIFDPIAEYGLSDTIGAKVSYTGYLFRPLMRPQARATDQAPYVLCTVGGGRDGMALCEAFARTPMPAGLRGILVTGTQIAPAEARRLQALVAANPAIELKRFTPDLVPLMAGAERIVAMGGYNTTCEAIALGKPTLIVPRIVPRREQIVRAERFAELGLIDVLRPDALSAPALAAWLGRPARSDRRAIALDGLEQFQRLATGALGPHFGLNAAA